MKSNNLDEILNDKKLNKKLNEIIDKLNIIDNTVDLDLINNLNLDDDLYTLVLFYLDEKGIDINYGDIEKDLDKINCDDSIKLYLSDITRYPIMGKEEEEELTWKYYNTKDNKIKQKLLIGHLRYVVSVAKKFMNNDVSFEDIIQEGNIGFMKAIDRFDPKKGVRLTTYATWWIRQNIQRYLYKFSKPINQSNKLYLLSEKLKKVKMDYFSKNGVFPSDSYLMEVLNLDYKELDLLRLTSMDVVSLDSFLKNNDEVTDCEFIDVIDDGQKTVEQMVEEKIIVEKVNEVLNRLPERERFIIKNHNGINETGKIFTLDELGKVYHITRERVRQIELKRLKKLKSNRKLRALR